MCWGFRIVTAAARLRSGCYLRRGELALWARRWATGVVFACVCAAFEDALDETRETLNPRAPVMLAFRGLLKSFAVQSARAVKASRRLASLRRSTTFWHGVMRSRGVLTTVAPVKQGRDANDASTSSHVAFSSFEQVSAVVEGAQEAVPQSVPKHTVHAGAA